MTNLIILLYEVQDLRKMMDSTLLISFLCLIVLSAMYSGSETAFLTSHKAKILIWRRQNKSFSKILYNYIAKPEKFLIATLVGNNAVNVLYTTIGTLIFIPFMDEGSVTILLAVIILIFSEVSPKIYFSLMSDHYILYFSFFIRMTDLLLKPITALTGYISSLSLKSVSINFNEVQSIFSKEDIDQIFTESLDENHDKYDLLPLLKKTLLLKSTKVKEVMVPSVDMIFLRKEMSLEEVRKIFYEGNYSRLPVIDETIDKIIGTIHVKELLKDAKDISEVTHEALFIPDSKSCYEALKDLRLNKKSYAIVIDEFGATSGVVYVENIVSTIVGDIEPENVDVKTYKTIIELNKSIYKISGRALKEHLEGLGIEQMTGSFETMAGFILNKIQRIPKKGEVFDFDSFSIKILSATKQRIQWVLLEIKDAKIN